MDSTLDNLVAKSIRDNKTIGHVAHSTVLEIVEYARQLETRTCPACEAAARERDAAYEDARLMQDRLQRLRIKEPQRELADLRSRLEAVENVAFAIGAMDYYPCFVCGYNGQSYYKPSVHPCAARHHKYRDCINLAQAELRALLRKEAK